MDGARFVHQGLTSSDVLDTCFAVQLDRAGALLAEGVAAVAAALERRAFEHKDTLCVGRSHGVHAEPTSFGLKLAGHHAEFARAGERLRAARREIATCAISGPVGTFASVDPAVEAHVAEQMGLTPEPVSTQVIPRDRHAMYFAVLGVIAGAIGAGWRWEVRHLQRSEVGEAARPSQGPKRSSACPQEEPDPHREPDGPRRIVRAAVVRGAWRTSRSGRADISHFGGGRVLRPMRPSRLDFALTRLAGVVDGLVVDEAAMRRNLESRGGLVYEPARAAGAGISAACRARMLTP